MNQFTIEFKNAEDLANKIAEYNELMNPQKVVEEVKEETKKRRKKQTASIELPKEEPQTAVESPVKEVYESETVKIETEPTSAEVIEPEKAEEPTAEPAPPAEETTEPPVTDFDGNPVETETIEIEQVEKPVDNKEYWKAVKSWMGNDMEKAKSVMAVFKAHDKDKFDSDHLTDEIIKELDVLMK